MIVGDAVLRLLEPLPQVLRRREAPIAAEVGGERMIACAGDVTCNRVDRLDLAGETFRRACVEQTPVGALSTFGDFASSRMLAFQMGNRSASLPV